MRAKTFVIYAAVALAASTVGGNSSEVPNEIKARHGMMNLMSASLATLGGMARGGVAFDADAARMAAENLVAATGIHDEGFWIEGTSETDIDGSRAMADIWDDMEDFNAKMDATHEAAVKMAEAAGDLAGIRANIGSVDRACGACHKAYRVPEN